MARRVCRGFSLLYREAFHFDSASLSIGKKSINLLDSRFVVLTFTGCWRKSAVFSRPDDRAFPVFGETRGGETSVITEVGATRGLSGRGEHISQRQAVGGEVR